LKFDEQLITESRNVADALANHFISTFNTSCQTIIPSSSLTSDIPPTASSLPLTLQVRVGGDGIPSFRTKGCSDVFNLSNLKAISETFPFLWMGTAVVSVFKSQCNDISHNFDTY
jgi:hypothetical protein